MNGVTIKELRKLLPNSTQEELQKAAEDIDLIANLVIERIKEGK